MIYYLIAYVVIACAFFWVAHQDLKNEPLNIALIAALLIAVLWPVHTLLKLVRLFRNA